MGAWNISYWSLLNYREGFDHSIGNRVINHPVLILRKDTFDTSFIFVRFCTKPYRKFDL